MTKRRQKPKDTSHAGAWTKTAGIRAAAAAFVFSLVIPAAAPAFADPPHWAPAHGWRAKHHRPVHYGPRSWHPYPAYVVTPAAPPRYVQVPASGAAFCSRDLIGAVIGGGLGALAGTRVGKGDGRTVAIIVGTITGGAIGGSIGRTMDRSDAGCVGQALEYAPTGRAVGWRNPDADTAYTVTPVRTYQAESGRYCREYTTTATIGGREEQVYGTACRQPDGAWQIVSQASQS